MIVYLATNKITGKHYVGVTVNSLTIRIGKHANTAGKKKTAMANAIAKYGIRSFVWEVLHVCSSKEEMYKMEIFYIKKYNCISPNGYNLSTGGEWSAIGVRRSEEYRQKISLAKLGKKTGPRPKSYCDYARHRRYVEAGMGINCKIVTSEIPNVIAMRNEGLSFAKIAMRYDCTPSAVFYALRRGSGG